MDNQEEFLFVGQFCSSSYISKFIHEEVMKEFVFLHKLVNEGIRTEEIRDFSQELTISMFYQRSRVVVNLIHNSDFSKDKDELIENGFQTLWKGLTKN